MANLFEPQTGDVCYLSIVDVKDSLGTPYSTLTDAEIVKLIIQAQNTINSYLSSINADIECSFPCDDIPLNIKRATLLVLKSIYESQNTTSPIIGGVDTSVLPAGAVIKESSCDVSIEYNVGKSSANDNGNVCDNVSCDVMNMLECYRRTGLNRSMCGIPCITNCDCDA